MGAPIRTRWLFRSFALAAGGRWRCTAGGTISAGVLDHLLTHLTLKFLRLTAQFIQLVENRLEFFRGKTGHELILNAFTWQSARTCPLARAGP